MNRMASEADLPFLSSLSPEVSSTVLQKQMRDGRLQIIELDGNPIGFLKFYALWETYPFIEVIVLQPSMRQRGHGTAAVREWEEQMAAHGFEVALISTQSQETAQHFWRKVGYADCGSFSIENRPPELFMQRMLTRRRDSLEEVIGDHGH